LEPEIRDAPPIEIDERTLLERCLAGDRLSFEALAAPHLATARSFAARLLGNLDDAEDAVQDALLKAWRGLSGYHGRKGSFRGWFLRIVFNQCTDTRRRAEARRRHESAVPQPASSAPGARLEQRELLARVHAAMDTLPAKQRAALHLRVTDEMDYREIGEVLKLTPASARVYVVRARAVLRELLGPEVFGR
jgi:RNA polymerase sigma-70 factor (ECF subfamily)